MREIMILSRFKRRQEMNPGTSETSTNLSIFYRSVVHSAASYLIITLLNIEAFPSHLARV